MDNNTHKVLDEDEIEYIALAFSDLLPGGYKYYGLHKCNETDVQYFHSRIVEDFPWGTGETGFYNYRCFDDPKEIILTSEQQYAGNIPLLMKAAYKNLTRVSV